MTLRRWCAVPLVLLLVGSLSACAPADAAPTGRRPVVFVHGYTLHSSQWEAAKAAFRADGYTDGDMVAIDYDDQVSIAESAKTLLAAVDALRARTGAEKVDIVAHSMGSFLAKQCIIVTGCAGKVAHWMSLAGVDNGTSLELSPGVPSNEDVQGHTPLRQYLQDHWGDLVAQGVKVEVQWARTDGIVQPPELSKQPAPAVNREVATLIPLYHLVIFVDSAVIAETIRFLRT